MIEYKKLKMPENGGKTEKVLSLLCKTFGAEEEYLERRQLCGAESFYNEDYLFTAWEDGELIGNLHLTVNAKNKAFGVLGGMVVEKKARGSGVAKTLFGDACDFFDNLGGKALFLGTGNPVAAKLYEKFGFSFISGTVIMARVKGSSLLDFYNEIYSEKDYEITEMDDGCRIPIILPATARGKDVLMDINANIVNNLYATQISCTGLYPRLLKIKEQGRVLVSKLKNQGICAVLTEKETNGVNNIDCFAYSGYEKVLPEMIGKILEEGRRYSAIICKEDKEKLSLFNGFGFKVAGEYDYSFNHIHIPCYYCEINISAGKNFTNR